MSARIPTSTKALVVRKAAKASKPDLHHAVFETLPIPPLEAGQVLVKVNAVAFNARDLWILKGAYPNIGFGRVMGSDGAGVVIAATDPKDPLLNKRVFFTPMRGWLSDPDAPESDSFTVVGASSLTPFGAFSEYVVVERDEVLLTPDHLDDVHAAAWPIAAVTAWRATMINAQVKAGDTVLVTGAGGGVALTALQLCVAASTRVYVTSGSADKLRRATALGARGGVSYKDHDWPAQLGKLIAAQGDAPLSAVIDAGGADILTKVTPILKPGGRVVVFGMHASPSVSLTMRAVLKNHRLIGSTMGSRADLAAATAFAAARRLVPAVACVLDGLNEESVAQAFALMEQGDGRFGKVVLRVAGEEGLEKAKL